MPRTTASQITYLDDFMNDPPEVPAGKPGRVVIVSDSLPERNGVGAYYHDLVNQLDEYGFESELICPRGERGEYLKFPLPGDSTQRIWIPSPRRFRQAMREIRPQTVIVATPGPYGLLGAWWAKHIDVHLIIGFHTHFSGVTDIYEQPFLKHFSRFWFNCADKLLFHYGDQVLANSEGMVEIAQRLGAKRVDVMGTLLPLAAINEPVTPLRENLERVLFAGRLAPEKNIETIAKAAAELPDIQFTFAGNGPLKDYIEDQSARLPNLEYLGWISRAELLAQFDRADLLVLPSHKESFGTVALEAMARQRLALVSPACGIVDWPDLNETLYVIEPGQSVADAIRAIAAQTTEQRTALAAGARQAALKLNHSSLLHWRKLLSDEPVETPVKAV